MRSYAGYLLLEDVFDSIPSGVPLIEGLENSVFNPNLLIVEDDCGTTLGKQIELTFESEGLIASDTLVPLNRERITTLLSQGKYNVYTRHSSSCISKGGICATCYAATYPNDPLPKINDRVTIKTEYLANAEIVFLQNGNTSSATITNPELYDKWYVYTNGQLLENLVDYTIVNGVFTLLNVSYVGNTFITIRFMKLTRTPYMAWLSNTYSGYMLGMKPLPAEKLQIKSLYLSSELTGNRLQLVSDYVEGLTQIPKEYTDYISAIRDPLEKALYLLAIFSIYYNAST